MSDGDSNSGDTVRLNKKILLHRGLIGLSRILENILLAL